MLSCSAVVWLERDGRSWVREGKSSRSGSLSALQVWSQHRTRIQLGCRALGAYDPAGGCAMKHSQRGAMSMHRVCDSLTQRLMLLCAWVSTLAQPLLHASRGLGSTLWGIHL